MQTPLGIEILRKRGHKRQDTLYFEAGEDRHDGVQRDGVAHYCGDLWQQPGHRWHHKTAGALAVDQRLDLVPSRLFDNRLDRFGVVIERGLVECPGIGGQVDTGAPVFKPDVVAIGDKVVDDSRLNRGTEDVGAYTRAMYKQYRPFVRRCLSLHMNEIALEAISSAKRDNIFAVSLLLLFLSIFLHRISNPWNPF